MQVGWGTIDERLMPWQASYGLCPSYLTPTVFYSSLRSARATFRLGTVQVRWFLADSGNDRILGNWFLVYSQLANNRNLKELDKLFLDWLAFLFNILYLIFRILG